jgi:DNA-directed RNA polymerase specialized sigma54-like protein
MQSDNDKRRFCNHECDYALSRRVFIDGDETKLKPMILKDIADLVGLDISTISRVANSKYVETLMELS